ncbi:plasmid pRiA4b ORF-3 family protein [Actinoplanes bogorensis]|uniref:Plasmid pRiA4b ORF-3 family protein n=1 Tax=Paractinoplanes bogorensis TaxID=1610840 RepID=A0ABS5YGH3_9ACTN|nr:plasmid pRiA4b ORF-3 family protein [Actinoplanes bogorensis]MBU2662470.1 plasmid pRiA4b ORF-3 family protein [Actinoplanes bogorensis]
MSPVSRGRKKSKSRQPGERVLRAVPAVPEECDCPDCTGEPLDPAELLPLAADLLAVSDPLEAELFGANVVAAGVDVVPALAQSHTTESVAMLLAIGAVEAAEQMTQAGVPAPAWAAELAQPITVGQCRVYGDQVGETSMLLCTFERAGRAHGFLVDVDHLDCDSAADILLFPIQALGDVEQMVLGDARAAGVEPSVAELDPAEFRWQVERALDARAVHDDEDGDADDDLDEEDGPGYHPVAVLLRARMAVLPEPPRPPAPHGNDKGPAALARPVARPAARKLPAKRKTSDGPAPIYQVKVSLVGAVPPNWRRLEIPGDIGLADLHRMIQTSFEWDDSHLHVFETPYGEFGFADRELGHRAEKPVTLEQVAPDVRDRVGYVYDFGDNWELEIVVEEIRDRRE